jgi:dTDP-4-amino-4,6-dideoxy-D-galactose acyltransferase
MTNLIAAREPDLSRAASEPVFETRRLDFDSRLFGSTLGTIARIATADRRLSPDQEARELATTLQQARADGYQHVIYRVPADNLPGVWAAEQAGLKLVDIGVDSTFTYAKSALPEPVAGVLIRPGQTADIQPLQDLAASAFVRSRFVVDPFFSADQNELLHREWVKNLFGGLAQAILVAEIEGELAGFVSCSMHDQEGRIPLIATRSTQRRRGAGRALVAAALAWFAGAGALVAHVKTQANNYPALALYHRSGYVVSHTELTFSSTTTLTAKAQQGELHD